MLEEIITLDKLVRWGLCALLILAVYFVTNSMSEVLLPFFSLLVGLSALPVGEIHREIPAHTRTRAIYYSGVIGACWFDYRHWTTHCTLYDRTV